MLNRPVRYAPVSDSGTGEQVADRPGHDHVPAVLPRAGPDVHHPVGGADGVLVVLHHDQRVAQVPQPDQRLQQPVVIPLMQPDRRLIQHIQHPGQPRPDLGGQPDPLRLPARQRGRGPVQGQVVQADVEQEAEPGADLGEDGRRDLRVPARSGSGRQQLSQLADGQRAELRDGPAVHGHGPRDRLEPGPWQAGQGTSRMNPANRSRLESDSASACRRSMNGIAPSNVASVGAFPAPGGW